MHKVSLLGLPLEILVHIDSYLGAYSNSNLRSTCTLLYTELVDKANTYRLYFEMNTIPYPLNIYGAIFKIAAAYTDMRTVLDVKPKVDKHMAFEIIRVMKRRQQSLKLHWLIERQLLNSKTSGFCSIYRI